MSIITEDIPKIILSIISTTKDNGLSTPILALNLTASSFALILKMAKVFGVKVWVCAEAADRALDRGAAAVSEVDF